MFPVTPNVSNEELINIKLRYVSVLKRIKNQKPDGEDKEAADVLCFMKDNRGNITLKILSKKEGKTKKTQQATGSACKHSDIDTLNELLSSVKGENVKEKGKGLICDKISYYMREKDIKQNEIIYFYGLDEYLELNKN